MSYNLKRKEANELLKITQGLLQRIVDGYQGYDLKDAYSIETRSS